MTTCSSLPLSHRPVGVITYLWYDVQIYWGVVAEYVLFIAVVTILLFVFF